LVVGPSIRVAFRGKLTESAYVQPSHLSAAFSSTALTMANSYKDLRVWKQSVDLALEIYRYTQNFPKHELYGLTSQLRRAAVSVSSNIAEGKGRSSDKELILFLHHSRGSLLELETQVFIARELAYIEEPQAKHLLSQVENLAKALNALINSLKKSIAA
jgi:four helix bundle protein